MAPAAVLASREADQIPGPRPSLIEVAKPYVFEERIRQALESVGMQTSREDQIRMNGVLWIDQVRKALQLYALRRFCAARTLLIQAVLSKLSTQLWCTITSFVWSTRRTNMSTRWVDANIGLNTDCRLTVLLGRTPR